MAVPPGTSQLTHLIAGTPTLVMVLNAVVAGAIVAIALIRFASIEGAIVLIVAPCRVDRCLRPGGSIRTLEDPPGPAGARADVPDAAVTIGRERDRRAGRPPSTRPPDGGGIPQLPFRPLDEPVHAAGGPLGRSRRGDPSNVAPDPRRGRRRGPRGQSAGSPPGRGRDRGSCRTAASGWTPASSKSCRPTRRQRSRCTPATRNGTSSSAAATSCSRRLADPPSSRTSTAAVEPATGGTSRTTSALISTLNVIHQEAGGPLEPTDLPVETRHLDMYACLATTLDKTWHCLGFGAMVVDDALEVAALARGVPRDAARARAVGHHDHQHELAAPARRADERRA